MCLDIPRKEEMVKNSSVRLIYFSPFFSVMDDSCVAMEQWVLYPTAHTALDDIIPCVDRATAKEALDESKDVSTRLVGTVNALINNVANLNVPPNPSPIYYNQSGALVSALCSPYNSDKTDRKCNADEVNLGNAAQRNQKVDYWKVNAKSGVRSHSICEMN
ncbi:hypothetical protein QQP08_020309 [Theobroma cacao]|nr:hypothetical protein QQP08_020309 [Theobroma cacao]